MTRTLISFNKLLSTTNSKFTRDVTDSKSASESDGIRQFFRNPKSDGYLKSNRDGFKMLVSVQLKCYFRK